MLPIARQITAPNWQFAPADPQIPLINLINSKETSEGQ
jgi:hypothetical protein